LIIQQDAARAHYLFVPAEKAKAFLTAADSFAQLQDKDPSSQAFGRSMGGRLAGSGIFGVRTNGAPISRRPSSEVVCPWLASAFAKSNKRISRRCEPRNSI